MEINQPIEEQPLTDDGGGGNSAPPKGYSPILPQQRGQWNGFVDYLKSQGNINLNDPQVPINFLNQYKQNNPDFSITPEMIPAIQYENNQLRKGTSFGNLSADQLTSVRQGLSPNFINTTDVYKSYYPQFKSGSQDFGTNIEDYAKFKSGGQSSALPPTTATTPPANANGPVSPASPGSIPRPNYDDPKSRLNYLKQMAPKYGDFVHGRGDYILNVDYTPDTDQQSLKESSVQAAKKVGLDPALLYSSSMEEGMSGLVPDKNGDITTGTAATKDYPVDGFFNFGVDHFHDNFNEMVKKGYLPKDFDYQKARQKNPENGEVVNSANFKTATDALQAKAAYVRMEQDNLESWAKKSNIQMSPMAKQFFTLIAFNGGPGRAHILLNYYKNKGLLDGDKFLNAPPEKKADPGGAYGHVLPRIKMANLLKKEGLF